MRRKSERNKSKSSAEKKTVEPSPRKSRRTSRRRKRSTSHSSSDDSDDVPLKTTVAVVEKQETVVCAPAVEPKKSTSHSASDEDKQEQPIWKVKTSEAPSGEIQKLKICLQRPPTTPERTEKSPRRRRGKASSQSDDASLTPDEKAPVTSGRRRLRRDSPAITTPSALAVTTVADLDAIVKDECTTLVVPESYDEVRMGKGKFECSQTTTEGDTKGSRTVVLPPGDESLTQCEIKQDDSIATTRADVQQRRDQAELQRVQLTGNSNDTDIVDDVTSVASTQKQSTKERVAVEEEKEEGESSNVVKDTNASSSSTQATSKVSNVEGKKVDSSEQSTDAHCSLSTGEIKQQSKEAASKQSKEAASKQSKEAASKLSKEAASKQSKEATLERIIKVASKQTTEPAGKEQTKTGVKEIKEEASQQIIKAASKQTSEPVVKEITKTAVKEISEEASQKIIEATTLQIIKAASQKITEPVVKEIIEPAVKEITKTAVKETSKEASQKITKATSEKTTEPAVKKISEPALKEITTTAEKEINEEAVKKTSVASVKETSEVCSQQSAISPAASEVASQETNTVASQQISEPAVKKSSEKVVKDPPEAAVKETSEVCSQQSAISPAASELTSQETNKAASQQTKVAVSEETKEAAVKETREAGVEKTKEASTQPIKEAASTETHKAASQQTKGAVSEETKEAAVQQTKEATVRETKEATVQETKEATVQETKEAAVQQTKQAAVQQTKEATVQETKEAAVQETKDVVQETKEVASQETSEATKQETKDSASQVTKEATRQEPVSQKTNEPRQETSEASRQETKEASVPESSEATAQDTSEAVSDQTLPSETNAVSSQKTNDMVSSDVTSQNSEDVCTQSTEVTEDAKAASPDTTEASNNEVTSSDASAMVASTVQPTVTEVTSAVTREQCTVAPKETSEAECIQVDSNSEVVSEPEIPQTSEQSERKSTNRESNVDQKDSLKMSEARVSESVETESVTEDLKDRNASPKPEKIDVVKSTDGDGSKQSSAEKESSSSEPIPTNVTEDLTISVRSEPEIRKPTNRKRRWGKYEALVLVDEHITMEKISKLYPSMKILSEDELRMDTEDAVREKPPRKEREVTVQAPALPPVAVKDEDVEKEVSNIGLNRKISIVNDEASKLQPPPSPSKNAVSAVLYITNLVRPFTLKQLKELLSRMGTILDDGFWTDRIKSKCYVQYENADEAEATRNALHGVQWPIGNGKKLMIDFGTQEAMEAARNATTEAPLAVAVVKPAPEKLIEKVPPTDVTKKEPHVEESRWEKTKAAAPVREWDVGKVPQDQRDRSRSRERPTSRNDRTDKRRHSRNESPPNGDHVTARKKKKDEPTELKLMDDLFHKTKATPSIYWLPLTPEQIAKKQQQRLQRMAEHKRRMEESRRGERDFGRGGARTRRRSARHDGD